ncbi:MAG: N-acetylmuramoyl-L-alanine amidase [Actinomycetota bacterium]
MLATAACKGDAKQHHFPTGTTTSSTSSTTTTSTTLAPTTLVAPISRTTKVVITSTGVVAPVVGFNADGSVAIRTPCENVANVRKVTAVGPVDVVIDPGHGGVENGAEGHGIPEKTINLAVAKHVVDALNAAGIHALLTRTADYRVTLTERANIAHALNPKAFVSVHHNGDSDGPRDGPGTEVFFQHASADSRRLAGLIYEEVVKALSQYQGVPWQADRDAGVKPRLNDSGGDYYAMLRQPAPVVSVIAELLFLSNEPEAQLVARPDVQLVEGDAVARGVIRYLTTSDPGSGFVEPYARTQPAGGGGGLSGCTDPPLQ